MTENAKVWRREYLICGEGFRVSQIKKREMRNTGKLRESDCPQQVKASQLVVKEITLERGVG